jgi:glucose/mannose transport system permease protein
MIILGHISLKIFDLVFAMAGPDNAQTVVPGLLVYTEGFRENAFAKASAIAVIMLFFVALIIVPYLWTQLREARIKGS